MQEALTLYSVRKEQRPQDWFRNKTSMPRMGAIFFLGSPHPQSAGLCLVFGLLSRLHGSLSVLGLQERGQGSPTESRRHGQEAGGHTGSWIVALCS